MPTDGPGIYLVSIRKLPLPWRERVGVRGNKTEVFECLPHYHPHPFLPHRGGGEKLGLPDGHYLVLASE